MASQSADLFGPDPGVDPLAYYCGDPDGDLYCAAPAEVAAPWRQFVAGLAQQNGGDLAGAQARLDRHVEELGLAFRLTGDDKERPWPLGPVPILIGAQEWAGIVAALVQRADLLEA
ncbi:MAG: hypothetical protein H5U21_07160, partial [Porphyrobacter sp.]|nr:hypothetical protein [Porphyrobacter sp.]